MYVETFIEISFILLVRSLGSKYFKFPTDCDFWAVVQSYLLVKGETEPIVFKGDETLTSVSINNE